MKRVLRALVTLLSLGGVIPAGARESAATSVPFTYRGYYFILSRNPTYGLDDYRRIADRMADDGANIWILWIGGGFPSRRYPETWDYNREHRNVRENFAGKVIDHAHSRKIRVLLGLTPFAYDGVNRYGAAHPELGATDASGKPAVTGGIHSMGRGLCPSKAAAREFQLGYCRELFDEFYPQADGLFLEHSDYGSCECTACAGGAGLRREWEFVDEISRHVWSRKPEAIEMINPKYATLGVAYDPRYIVFLAPHNATGAELVKNPKILWHGYWDDAGFFQGLCRTAARDGLAGVIPSMENFTYEHAWAFDTRWGPEGSAGWDDLLVRVTRFSFREFSARPELEDADFRRRLKETFFDDSTPASAVDDLLALHRRLNRWTGWTRRGGVMKVPDRPVDPALLSAKDREELSSEIRPALASLAEIRTRAQAIADASPGTRGAKTATEMAAIAGWVLAEWEGKLPPAR
ncbi:MAG TPA: hypothetical protein VFD71_13770 [Planctomycetota bacterium]|nr:hypothetical protein [Planctomycetota bacterium]